MDSALALDIGKESIYVLLSISLPLLLVSLITGLLIALFQALTQIQEMTLTFVPKIIAIFVALIMLLPYIGSRLNTLAESLASLIVVSGGG